MIVTNFLYVVDNFYDIQMLNFISILRRTYLFREYVVLSCVISILKCM